MGASPDRRRRPLRRPPLPVRPRGRRPGDARDRRRRVRGAGPDRPRDIGAVLERAGAGWEHVLRDRVLPGRRGRLPRLEPDLVRAVRAAPAGPDDGRHAVRGPGHPDRAPGHGRASGRRRVSGRVVVVGGGIAGLCCAYYLRATRHDVTIVESNRIGSGRLVRERRLAVPRPGRPAARAGADAVRACAPSSTATRRSTSSRATARLGAVAAALLDVLQRARPRARHGGDRRGSGTTSST